MFFCVIHKKIFFHLHYFFYLWQFPGYYCIHNVEIDLFPSIWVICQQKKIYSIQTVNRIGEIIRKKWIYMRKYFCIAEKFVFLWSFISEYLIHIVKSLIIIYFVINPFKLSTNLNVFRNLRGMDKSMKD